MTILAIFGIGQTELILVSICFMVLILPLVVAGVIVAIVVASRNRNDRQQ